MDGFDDGCLGAGTYAFSDDASELGPGERSDNGVEFASDPTRIVRHLNITLGDDGNVAASAEAVVGTNNTSGTPSTPGATPGSAPRNSTSE